jgi:hypothetical protein
VSICGVYGFVASAAVVPEFGGVFMAVCVLGCVGRDERSQYRNESASLE